MFQPIDPVAVLDRGQPMSNYNHSLLPFRRWISATISFSISLSRALALRPSPARCVHDKGRTGQPVGVAPRKRTPRSGDIHGAVLPPVHSGVPGTGLLAGVTPQSRTLLLPRRRCIARCCQSGRPVGAGSDLTAPFRVSCSGCPLYSSVPV